MNYGSLDFKTNILNDRLVDIDQIEDESVFEDEITDEAMEVAASGRMVTFSLSTVLFACQFC